MIDELLKKTEVFVDGEKVVIIEDEDDEINNLINEIETSLPKEIEIELEEKKIENPLQIDLDEKHSLANKIVENSLDVIKNSKMVFDNFSDDVIHGKDRSTSSKEMLIKALEVQNQANKNLIDLARSLDGDKGNTNILITSSISPKKSGINPENIKNHFGK